MYFQVASKYFVLTFSIDVISTLFKRIKINPSSGHRVVTIGLQKLLQLNQYLSYKAHSSFKPTWFFLKILFVSLKGYIFT